MSFFCVSTQTYVALLYIYPPPPKKKKNPDRPAFFALLFTRESSYCFQRVLATTVLSVCLPVTRVDQSKLVQTRITKSSPSAAWKTLVSGTVKLFYKFEEGHHERWC